jgi:hypothetical protein
VNDLILTIEKDVSLIYYLTSQIILKEGVSMSDALKQGLGGSLMGAVMSFIINYFLIPLPATVLGNALNHTVTGIISGFMGGFMGILLYFYSQRRKRRLKG